MYSPTNCICIQNVSALHSYLPTIHICNYTYLPTIHICNYTYLPTTSTGTIRTGIIIICQTLTMSHCLSAKQCKLSLSVGTRHERETLINSNIFSLIIIFSREYILVYIFQLVIEWTWWRDTKEKLSLIIIFSSLWWTVKLNPNPHGGRGVTWTCPYLVVPTGTQYILAYGLCTSMYCGGTDCVPVCIVAVRIVYQYVL